MYTLTRTSILLLALMFFNPALPRPKAAPESEAQQLSLEEAEILAYLTPYGVSNRRTGSDVRVVPGDACFQPGFVDLDVISLRPFPAGGGPENHEHVAVNLHTGQVYNWIPIPAEEVSTPEMDGVARIMRMEHGLAPSIVEKYRSMQPILQAGSAPCDH